MKSSYSIAFLSFFAASSFAASLVVCNTGLNTASASGCGNGVSSPNTSGLGADGNWKVAYDSSGSNLTTYTSSQLGGMTYAAAYATQNGTSAYGAWGLNNQAGFTTNTTSTANNGGSAWIQSTNEQVSGAVGIGNYIYQTTFNATGFNLSTLSISGLWNGDNLSAGIYLNGVLVSTATNGSWTNAGEFMASNGMVAFNFNSANIGTAAFNGGLNTLSFVVYNQNGPGANPSGIRVAFGPAGAPEPSSVIMLGLGLLAVGGGLARKRRIKS
jgi:hypothetical protein